VPSASKAYPKKSGWEGHETRIGNSRVQNRGDIRGGRGGSCHSVGASRESGVAWSGGCKDFIEKIKGGVVSELHSLQGRVLEPEVQRKSEILADGT